MYRDNYNTAVAVLVVLGWYQYQVSVLQIVNNIIPALVIYIKLILQMLFIFPEQVSLWECQIVDYVGNLLLPYYSIGYMYSILNLPCIMIGYININIE